jgi:pimeloyl-ACP methyl ester carboxylesterase
MPFFTFPDGVQIYYDELGDGPAMLLLHAGWGRYVNWFYSQMEAFREGISHPENYLEERAIQRLREGHGTRWRQVVANWGNAWLALYEMAGDLYNGRLGEIGVPTLVLHGVNDPHTDLEEIEALADQIPGATLHLFPEVEHSLHSERGNRDECNRLVREFLQV